MTIEISISLPLFLSSLITDERVMHLPELHLKHFIHRTFSIPLVNLMKLPQTLCTLFYHISPPPNTLHFSQVLDTPLSPTKQTSKKQKRGRHWSAGPVCRLLPWSKPSDRLEGAGQEPFVSLEVSSVTATVILLVWPAVKCWITDCPQFGLRVSPWSWIWWCEKVNCV